MSQINKITLTRKEAAELLGISTATVTQWVMEGRLKAYRVSEKPKSPYLFTREDCQDALKAVGVEPTTLKSKEHKIEAEVAFTRRQEEVNKKLRQMLNMPKKE
ncbi:helix-turn-helix domain-containing protein [Enterobacter roggenkampii]|uniref:helix-turn-helix domain-containing protein n=1 Tax=Enterobacter roggenkampii TaxID=1812935 RepID=UPI001C5B07A0|nr:helix-turn-helix domain-containing protein [Enterobacter roggenkampii]MBW4237028.1 excisionase family DNA-binding protein [Enterobacter roggenkampii]